MINIAELLKDAPKGMKLYSPLLGEVEFAEVMDTDYVPIRVLYGSIGERFDEFGRYKGNEYPNAECLLFPSKDCRTWEGWKLPVEPKFKKGNWLYHNSNGIHPVLVTDYDERHGYQIQDGSGRYHLSRNLTENEYHLWSIADAKDGDVLVTTKIRSCPFIYRKTSYKNNLAYYYAGIDGNGNFSEGCLKRTLCHFGPVSGVAPATKEQRDLLFVKVKEAGYQWDGEKKKLKKIQPHYDISNFQAGMPVLVRDMEGRWSYVIFSHTYTCIDGKMYFNACGWTWEQCIPFNEDTKHLLGTTDMPSEEYINW